jgi:murein DD-endopeptidase MepM/ murein hydrolase activator NlpD
VSRHRTPRAQREGSRIPRPPSNRGPLILAALVIGAVLAWLPGGISAPQAPTAVSADNPYGIGSDTGFPLDADGAPRQAISEAEAAARLEAMAASRDSRAADDAAAAAVPRYVLPLSGRLTSCFCMRWGTMHQGLDIAAPTGTPIVAPEDGVVLEAGPSGGYGNVVYLQHANGDVTLYGHMSKVLVQAGQIVLAGEVIAEVGSTGYSTGPHLHFEVHPGGRDSAAADPAAWLLERGIDIAALPTSD